MSNTTRKWYANINCHPYSNTIYTNESWAFLKFNIYDNSSPPPHTHIYIYIYIYHKYLVILAYLNVQLFSYILSFFDRKKLGNLFFFLNILNYTSHFYICFFLLIDSYCFCQSRIKVGSETISNIGVAKSNMTREHDMNLEGYELRFNEFVSYSVSHNWLV